jgi:hypothetical protein
MAVRLPAPVSIPALRLPRFGSDARRARRLARTRALYLAFEAQVSDLYELISDAAYQSHESIPPRMEVRYCHVRAQVAADYRRVRRWLAPYLVSDETDSWNGRARDLFEMLTAPPSLAVLLDHEAAQGGWIPRLERAQTAMAAWETALVREERVASLHPNA